MRTSSPPVSPAQGAQFFVSQKRGEIRELRSLLRTLPTDDATNVTSRNKRREILKRLIAYMALGIDVSSLFPDVVLASATKDVVQKKLIAMYLNRYAETNGDTAILAINTFQKDLRELDPTIRGLALKALTSLRASTVEEYALNALKTGMSDKSEYVCKAAIIGALKLRNQTDEQTMKEITNLLEQAKAPQIFTTALLVLNELNDGLSVPRKLIVKLFNQLEKCGLFDKCVLLSLLSSYNPSKSSEMLALLESLEPLVHTTSPSLVLESLRVMLLFVESHVRATLSQRTGGVCTTEGVSRGATCPTKGATCQEGALKEVMPDSDDFSLDGVSTNPPLPSIENMGGGANCLMEAFENHALTRSILRRSKISVLTLLINSSNEATYTLIQFIHALISISPKFAAEFEENWQEFIPKHQDKAYNKLMKLRILYLLYSETIWRDLVDCMLNYLTPPTCVAEAVLAESVKLMTHIALDIPDSTDHILNELLTLYEMGIPEVSSVVIGALAVILSRNPDKAEAVMPYLDGVVEFRSLSTSGLQALVWLIGEHPLWCPYRVDMLREIVDDALESLGKSDEVGGGRDHILSDTLTACMKILLKDPHCIKTILATLIQTLTERITDLPPDLMERVLVCVRLLTRSQDVLMQTYKDAATVQPIPKRSRFEAISNLREAISSLGTLHSVAGREIPCLTLPLGGIYAPPANYVYVVDADLDAEQTGVDAHTHTDAHTRGDAADAHTHTEAHTHTDARSHTDAHSHTDRQSQVVGDILGDEEAMSIAASALPVSSSSSKPASSSSKPTSSAVSGPGGKRRLATVAKKVREGKAAGTRPKPASNLLDTDFTEETDHGNGMRHQGDGMRHQGDGGRHNGDGGRHNGDGGRRRSRKMSHMHTEMDILGDDERSYGEDDDMDSLGLPSHNGDMGFRNGDMGSRNGDMGSNMSESRQGSRRASQNKTRRTLNILDAQGDD